MEKEVLRLWEKKRASWGWKFD